MGLMGNILFFPGCMLRQKLPELEKNYEQVLKQLGISYVKLNDFSCCGAPMLYGGYKQDFDEWQEKMSGFLKQYNIKNIITACPACARILAQEYRIKAEHITQTIADNLRKLPKKYDGETICYHDPCELGRKSGVYDEPRQILKKLGFNVVEFETSRENALCCGAGGLLKANSPRAADRIAMLRLKQAKAKKIITTCPLCYIHLKKNAKDLGIEVLELSEVLQ